MSFRNLMGVTSIFILLAACGSDDNNTATSSEPLSASEAYQGSIATAAVQTDTIAKSFSLSAFAARDYSLSASSLPTWLPELDAAGSETCSNGGRATQVSEIDNATRLGSKTINFDNCDIAGVLVDGTTVIEVSAYDQALSMPTAVKTTYDGLSQTRAGKVVTLTGTLDASQNYAAKTVDIRIDLHMKANTGEETLTNMDVEVSGDASKRSALSRYTGDVCMGAEGCVAISTQTPFNVDFNGHLTAGEMTLNGAADTTARIVVGANNDVTISLDG